MAIGWVQLELDVSQFDLSRFGAVVSDANDEGVALTTLEDLGNTEAEPRLMYDLNAECAADIPERGRQITLAMKIYGLGFVSDLGVSRVRTTDHPKNFAMINLNRGLGYTDATREP